MAGIQHEYGVGRTKVVSLDYTNHVRISDLGTTIIWWIPTRPESRTQFSLLEDEYDPLGYRFLYSLSIKYILTHFDTWDGGKHYPKDGRYTRKLPIDTEVHARQQAWYRGIVNHCRSEWFSEWKELDTLHRGKGWDEAMVDKAWITRAERKLLKHKEEYYAAVEIYNSLNVNALVL